MSQEAIGALQVDVAAAVFSDADQVEDVEWWLAEEAVAALRFQRQHSLEIFLRQEYFDIKAIILV